MKKKEISSKDFLLSLLYCSGRVDSENEPIIGRTKLTKMVFLFEKEIQQQFFSDIEIKLPDFSAYNFGPFSKELFDDLSFFLSIGFIHEKETLIPISAAEKQEVEIGFDDDWMDAGFDESEHENVEMEYTLSPQAVKYVKENIWSEYSDNQKQNLKKFKAQINAISLDVLLRYVYNRYPDYAKNSLIANKYLNKDTVEHA
ncbi:MAG TPA: hypothetical protein DEQ30_12865 [Porphyromonadaceae bacterium]|nr:hypothetical protein [Porphyromonadaceae bacterium]